LGKDMKGEKTKGNQTDIQNRNLILERNRKIVRPIFVWILVVIFLSGGYLIKIYIVDRGWMKILMIILFIYTLVLIITYSFYKKIKK
jgi:hypothetical protein